MARKRGNGEGSVYQRGSDGRWVAALIMDDGRRITRTAKTRAEALGKLEALRQARADHIPVAADRNVAEFLQEWLRAVEGAVSVGFFRRYEQAVRIHVIPALGRMRLQRLTPQHFQTFYRDKLAAELSPTTVNHLHAVLRIAFGQAVRWGLLPATWSRWPGRPGRRMSRLSHCRPAGADAACSCGRASTRDAVRPGDHDRDARGGAAWAPLA